MEATIGFISVRQHAEQGYFGGYLIVNRLARPLEFHCTLPISPTRAQVLLYGRTIDEFLCGEQIAKALTTKAKLRPDLVLTDCPATLAITNVSTLPVAYYEVGNSGELESSMMRIPTSAGELVPLNLTHHKLFVLTSSSLSATQVESTLGNLAGSFVLSEPFSRIVDALTEANPSVKAA